MEWKRILWDTFIVIILVTNTNGRTRVADNVKQSLNREKRETETKNSKISDTLSKLKVGQEPNVISKSETYSNAKASKDERVTQFRERELQLKELTTSSVSRFEAKHLFENGLHKGATDSFDALNDPNRLKSYLTDINRKVYKGGVLPQDTGNQFQKWLERADTDGKPLTIIDADINVLANDIKPKFEAWKQEQLTQHGKLPDKFPDFTTDSQQKVTQLSFEPVRNEKGDIVDISVKMEQLNTRVELGTDANGKITHFARLDPVDSSLPDNKIREKSHATNFQIPELEMNAQATREFWKELGLPANKQNIILNDQAQSFKDLVRNNDADLQKEAINPSGGTKVGEDEINLKLGICSSKSRSKRAASESKCAVFLNPKGEVDSVHPKEFMEEYKKADPEGKRQLADLAKNSIDKVDDFDGDGVERNKIRKLVELEQVKSHVGQVDTVKSLETPGSKRSRMKQGFATQVQNLKTKVSKIKAKVSSSKMAKTLSSLASTKGAKRLVKGTGLLSTYFLAKTVVNGIVKGDTTSLAIVGARIGAEVGMKGISRGGLKFFSGASKVGKAFKAIGAVAGPLGAMADISLSVYSLTKSIERYQSATDMFDKRAAAADIVSDSVDIAVTAAVAVLSTMFPPAAPLVIAVGLVIDTLNKMFTSMYKAGNEVDRINAEIPLLESEKSMAFNSRFFDWFGTREKDYLDHLVEEKKANDLAVQHNLMFLQNNIGYLGVVFPSRTISYEGSCRLTKQRCATKHATGCTRWSDKNAYTVASGCDRNKKCGSYDACTDYWVPDNVNTVWGVAWSYYDYKCKCDGTSKTKFGYPRKNQVVDFRTYQSVYWERAVPEDVEDAEFKCKPGNTSFVDYKTHQESSRIDYLCENAIALLQPWSRRRDGQIMLFDLEDGDDRVYNDKNDPTPNLFRVGNEGIKYFDGGKGKNEFLFDKDCSLSLKGTLAGGSSESDSVTISESCARGSYIILDFQMVPRYILPQIRTESWNVKMSLQSIEEVNGRPNEGEHLTVDCNLRKVALLGGSYARPDIIKINDYTFKPVKNDYSSSYNCPVEVEALVSDFTTIQSEPREGTISLKIDSRWRSVGANLVVGSRQYLKLSMTFQYSSSNDVISQLVYTQGLILSAIIKKMGGSDQVDLKLNFTAAPVSERSFPVYFVESLPGGLSSTRYKTPYSVLILSLSSPPVFYHTFPELDSTSTFYRVGSQGTPNIFEIKGNRRYNKAVGGDRNDEFILYTPRVLELDGRGGDDTLRLQPSLKGNWMSINLGSNYKNIENIYGTVGHPIEVVCACGTKLVYPQGGDNSSPDKITVPSGFCSWRNLHIVAKGHTKMTLLSQMGNIDRDTIHVDVMASDSNHLRFELETKSTSTAGLVVAIQLTHENWWAPKWNRSSDGQSSIVKLSGMYNDDSISLIIRDVTPHDINSDYLSLPAIQLRNKGEDDGPVGQLMLEQGTREVKVLYQLDNKSRDKKLHGLRMLPNMFLVSSGAWEIRGGAMKDVYTISNAAQREVLWLRGGDGDDNTLILDSDSSGQFETFGVNLETNEMGYLSSSNMGHVSRIQNILGRNGKPDSIHTNCQTKSVNGRGGAGKGREDLIFISGNGCPYHGRNRVNIIAGKHTKIKNSASYGHATYHVEDITSCELELKVSERNLHFIKFSFHPWGVIRNIGFDEEKATLGIKVGEENDERIQLFKMWRGDASEDYSNPVFEFYQSGTQVTSDIRVGKDGVVASTIMVHGSGLASNEMVQGLPLHINRFLINITERGNGARGSISGGVNAGANQFWIFQLESGLEVLDGGNCFQTDTETFDKNVQCTNYLELAENFETGFPIEIELDDEDNGFIKSGDKILVTKLTNFHEIKCRSGVDSVDKVIVSSCSIKQISAVEEIVITPTDKCDINLIMEIGEKTQVFFEELVQRNADLEGTELIQSIFHYRFKTPKSFDLRGNSEVAYLGSSHNYYLALKLDDLESISFDLESETMLYSLAHDKEVYHHSMIVGNSYEEQFYAQPVMVTQDGFKIQISRDGSILLSLGAGSSFRSSEDLRDQVIPSFEMKAKQLKVTIIVQTDSQFIYVGHGYIEGDRNVLENVDYSESHLNGGGANDTIYEILTLEEDVFLYPGFEIDNEIEFDESQTVDYVMKQTIDLTDIVVPIRMQSGTKYVPKVEKKEDDLVISMDGYEDDYPGRIWIINGALRAVASKLQLLLNNAIMDLIPTSELEGNARIKRSLSENNTTENNETEWKIHPRPILISDATVFSIAKEDLEDGHDIQIESNTQNASEPKNKAFTAARNGTDLYLTNVLSSTGGDADDDEQMEITTVIISDYFKDASIKQSKDDENEEERSVNGTDYYEDYSLNLTEAEGNELQDSNDSLSLFPDMVSGVTISLPGLHLLLNDSEVMAVKEKKEVSIDGSSDDKESGDGDEEIVNTVIDFQNPAQISEWKFVLFETEQEILEGVPEIPLVFKCDECHVKSYLLEYVVGSVALILVISVFVIPSIVREMGLRKKGKFDVARQGKMKNIVGKNETVELLNLSK